MKCPKCGSDTVVSKNDYVKDPQHLSEIFAIEKQFSKPLKFWNEPLNDDDPAKMECFDCGHVDDLIKFLPEIEAALDKKRMREALE